MSELYELAKPVRDATMAEVNRILADDAAPDVRDAHLLGVHLASVAMVWSASRFAPNTVVGSNLHDIFALAASHLLSYIAGNFRPMVNGRPVTPCQSGQLFLQKVLACTFTQLGQLESGQIDFSVPFERTEDGSIQPVAFDFRDLFKKEV